MLSTLAWNLLLTAGLAVLLAALCCLPTLRRRPALRHWLWLLLLVKLVTPPLVSLPLLPAIPVVTASDDALSTTPGMPSVKSPPSSPPPEHGKAIAGMAPAPQQPVGRSPSDSPGDRQPTEANTAVDDAVFAQAGSESEEVTSQEVGGFSYAVFLGGLLALSLIGTCVLLTVHGLHAVKFYRWLRRAGTENSLLAQLCADVASSLGDHGVVRSCVVDARTTPLLWGWHRPLVVVPRQLIDELSLQQLRSIVAHELAHLARRDHWANAFVFVVKALLWWNPVVWWADRELRAAQELCCDAIAIDRCRANRRGYAVTLLKALDFIQTEPMAPRALAAGMGSRQSILRRFEMIGETRLSYRLSRWTFLALLALAIPLVCMPVRGQSEPPAPPADCDPGDATPPAAVKDKTPESAKADQPKAGNAAARPHEMVVGTRPQGNCSISGQVVSAATGKPIVRGRMYLHYGVTHASVFVNTADDGTFTFKNISKGPYSLQLSLSAGYQDAFYDPDGKAGQIPQFTLKDGEHRTGIVLKAKPACRVSGKVVDENGNVPENIDSLSVLAWTKKNDGSGGYQNQQANVNRADGTYSIDGLRGQPIYVMAIDWQRAREGNAPPPIYYPSAFSRNDAKLIAFDKEQKISNVDITLKKEGGIVLEGTVRDESGKPVPDAFVVVHRRDMLFDFVTAYSDEQGHYKIQGLGDGEFLVHVDAIHRGFVRTRAPLDLDKTKTGKTAQRDFSLKRGASISGKFVDEQGKEWRIGTSFGFAYVVIEKPEEQSGPGKYSVTHFWNKHRPKDVAENAGGAFETGEGDYLDGDMAFPTKNTFLLQGLIPGQTTLGFLPNKERQKVVKILYQGNDVTKSGIPTKPGLEIKDVTIVIGSQ